MALKLYNWHIIFEWKKIKAKEKILRKARGQKHFTFRAKIRTDIVRRFLRNHARKKRVE